MKWLTLERRRVGNQPKARRVMSETESRFLPVWPTAAQVPTGIGTCALPLPQDNNLAKSTVAISSPMKTPLDALPAPPKAVPIAACSAQDQALPNDPPSVVKDTVGSQERESFRGVTRGKVPPPEFAVPTVAIVGSDDSDWLHFAASSSECELVQMCVHGSPDETLALSQAFGCAAPVAAWSGHVPPSCPEAALVVSEIRLGCPQFKSIAAARLPLVLSSARFRAASDGWFSQQLDISHVQSGGVTSLVQTVHVASCLPLDLCMPPAAVSGDSSTVLSCGAAATKCTMAPAVATFAAPKVATFAAGLQLCLSWQRPVATSAAQFHHNCQ